MRTARIGLGAALAAMSDLYQAKPEPSYFIRAESKPAHPKKKAARKAQRRARRITRQKIG